MDGPHTSAGPVGPVLSLRASLLTYLSYDASGWCIDRLTCGWPTAVRDAQIRALVAAVGEAAGQGILLALVPRAGLRLRHHAGEPLPVGDTRAVGTVLRGGRTPVILAATVEGENQVDLAMASADARRAAAAFPDPGYAPAGLEGSASLWPNRLARDVGDRLRACAAVDAAPLDVHGVHDRWVARRRELYPDDPEVLGELTLVDVLAGLLWSDDRPGLAGWLRAVTGRGLELPLGGASAWTHDTLGGLDLWMPVAEIAP
ncbi:hypothetical protein ACFUMH_00215 [Cellulomonas sp. NPDC057328]|uniref:hypothetical protein n=1 Tax=Cellulomonas sp. NPDC057328 TaxID=3346101 RepID=UPI00362FA134